MIKKTIIILSFLLILGSAINCQNVIVVVIDGARYSETFEAKDKNIPQIWNKLKEKGTIYTNFYNIGPTKTIPGHSSIITGNWQNIANDGTEHPKDPTIFEYLREQKNVEENKQYVIAGANKLSAVSYSNDSLFGENYKAAVLTNDYTGDLQTYQNLMEVLETDKPQLVLVNFKEVDIKGHAGDWNDYIRALSQVDSLVYSLWNWIETSESYANRTTMIITNDHGRHDENHGGFKNHGCSCEGCQHIMLLAIGEKVPENVIIDEQRFQVDVAPTIAELLSVKFPSGEAISLIDDFNTFLLDKRPDNISYEFQLYQNYPNPFNPSTTIKYSIPVGVKSEKANLEIQNIESVQIVVYDILGREVTTLVNEKQKPGNYEVEFNSHSSPSADGGRNLPSGVYFYKLQAGSFFQTKRMLLIK